MAKAKSISGYGKGWHKQSSRHSNARKTGTAGGKYATNKKPIKVKITKKQLIHAKNQLEIDLQQEINKTKDPHKKATLQHINEELTKADDHTKLKRFTEQYGNALQTLGMAIPFALISPLVVAGVILATTLTKDVEVRHVLPRIAMPVMATVIGAEATKLSIRTIRAINKEKKEIYNKAVRELKKDTHLPEKEIKKIAKRVSEQEISERKMSHELVGSVPWTKK